MHFILFPTWTPTAAIMSCRWNICLMLLFKGVNLCFFLLEWPRTRPGSKTSWTWWNSSVRTSGRVCSRSRLTTCEPTTRYPKQLPLWSRQISSRIYLSISTVDLFTISGCYCCYQVFDSVVDVSGHLRPPGQRVSVAESAVSRETVSGSGPEGTTVQTSGGLSAFFVSYVCGGEPTRACLGLQYLAFTCGLVRGALLSLGVKSIVTAEASIMPASKTRCRLHHQEQQQSFFFRWKCVFSLSSKQPPKAGHEEVRGLTEPAVTWTPPFSAGFLISYQSYCHSVCTSTGQTSVGVHMQTRAGEFRRIQSEVTEPARKRNHFWNWMLSSLYACR